MPSDDSWRKVGYVRRAHGIRGAVIIKSLSDDPRRFSVGATLRTDETPPRDVEVVESRSHNDGFLVTIAGLDGRDAAEAFKGTSLFVPASDRRTLEIDEFWPEDLVGLQVFTVDGDDLGVIRAVVDGAAQDRLRIGLHNGDDVEVPFVAALVPVVDMKARRVEVDLPVGLIGDGAIIDRPDTA
ncbi:16S rRNA processing protein RimM [hydrothermal vent metagenome]|uniref:16S rRNA processing protein RimM n=1 Tax=hydrothermal vent metagenome TaxID=652676 RepID=A0A3B0SQK2_9ZZZZ